MTSHAACSSALKSLEILMRAVVTIVVSKAEMNRQNHRPAMIVCSRAGLIFGIFDGAAAGIIVDFADMFTATEDARLTRRNASEDVSQPWKLAVHMPYALKPWGQRWIFSPWHGRVGRYQARIRLIM